MARTPRERGWLDAVEALYDGDDVPKAARDSAFGRAVARLHADDPRDPEGAARRPGVVVLHGSVGCWLPQDVELLGRRFAARGCVAFFPCRRGQGLSAGRGEAVMDQLRREGVLARDSAYAARSTALLETTQLADVRAAIASPRARPEVDPARVAVAGISYGGILTLLAAEADGALRAAVSFAPAAMNWGWNAPLRERPHAAAWRDEVFAFLDRRLRPRR